MSGPSHPSTDVAFTATVKAIQSRKGSRRSYERLEAAGGWNTRITPALTRFIEAQTSAFVATANGAGQPYVQHRGGPVGFLEVLDDRTIAFVDFIGNRQYITQGNLEENPKAHLLLLDHRNRRRIKIWGEACVIEGDTDLMARLMPTDYEARSEQAIVFTVEAWDVNCPQHIPEMYPATDVAAALAERERRIATLEAELARLRALASRR